MTDVPQSVWLVIVHVLVADVSSQEHAPPFYVPPYVCTGWLCQRPVMISVQGLQQALYQ